MAAVNIHEAKTRLSELLDRALRGEDIVIAKAGRPLVRMVPIDERRPRTPGLARGRVTDAFFEPISPEELEAWEGRE